MLIKIKQEVALCWLKKKKKTSSAIVLSALVTVNPKCHDNTYRM